MIQTMKETFSKRKNPRLQDFDYSTAGAYFITICTENRKNLLSHIVGGDVLDAPCDIELSEYGKIAEKYVNQLSDFYKDIVVEAYTIMPNHIHIMLMIQDVGTSRTSSPTKQSLKCKRTDTGSVLFLFSFNQIINYIGVVAVGILLHNV